MFLAVVQAPPCGSSVTPQEVLYDTVVSTIKLLFTGVLALFLFFFFFNLFYV